MSAQPSDDGPSVEGDLPFEGDEEFAAPPDSVLPGRFHDAREWLRKVYAARGAAKSLHPLFSPATLTRLFKSESDYPDSSFSASIQHRLVWLCEHGQEVGVYAAIENMIGHTEIGRSIIFRDFVGNYRLFRFAAGAPAARTHLVDGQPAEVQENEKSFRQASPLKLSFVEESLKIFCDGVGDPAFEYVSHETENDKIIVKGAVFYSLGHLFLPGLMLDGISLSIVSAARSGTMQGFMLSVARRGAGSPFSSRFLMVDDKNDAVLSKLRAEDGERAFFDLTAGAYAYYMIT